MIDLNQFVEWVKEGKTRRSVTINIGDPTNKEYLRVWVYDYDLEIGESVESVSEIDLIAKAIKEQKEAIRKLEQLKIRELQNESETNPNPNPL